MADTLSSVSRIFFERSYLKVVLSIIYAGFALMFLGFCSEAGALSQNNRDQYDSNSNSLVNNGDLDSAYTALIGGYGFASFCFFVSFVLALVAALHISPLVSGSANEAKTVKTPMEV